MQSSCLCTQRLCRRVYAIGGVYASDRRCLCKRSAVFMQAIGGVYASDRRTAVRGSTPFKRPAFSHKPPPPRPRRPPQDSRQALDATLRPRHARSRSPDARRCINSGRLTAVCINSVTARSGPRDALHKQRSASGALHKRVTLFAPDHAALNISSGSTTCKGRLYKNRGFALHKRVTLSENTMRERRARR